jgi:mono/diheme cytochrome c family protein
MARASRGRIAVLIAVAIIVVAALGWGLMTQRNRSDPTTATDPVPTLDQDEVALGREVYLNSCASCHGPNAEGAPNWTEPDASGNLPPPPHGDSGHTWRHSDAELARIIRNGQRDVFNESPELTMPAFAGRLTDEEIAAVIAYFKSLWSPEHRRFQEEQNQRPPMASPARN